METQWNHGRPNALVFKRQHKDYNSIAWIFKLSGHDSTHRRTPDTTKRDESVKFCTKCKRCWEFVYKSSQGYVLSVMYLHDFPTIGKKREICPNCKEV